MNAVPVSNLQQAPPQPEQHHRSWMKGPLPEVIGYVGAALVASAALNFVAQSWESWSLTVRLSVIGVAVVLLYAAGLTIMGIAGWRTALQSEERANRRRLVAVLFALAAPLVGAFLAVILDSRGLFDQVTAWLVLPAALAFLAAAAGAWCAPGAVSTIAVAGTCAWAGITSIMVIAQDQPEWWIPIAAAIGGALWLGIAPRLLAIPALSESLGMAWLLFMLGPAAVSDLANPAGITQAQAASVWVSRGLLVLMTVVALTLFARGASWAWAVGGVVAAVLASMGFAGQALGWVAALLVAGVVLLALSGLLLALRRRTSSEA
ncbi:MAG: hypothetical protein ACR2KE_08275 [Candidatus Nanopelagicales bacterium]